MRKPFAVIALAGGALSLAGCAHHRLGGKNGPDEFAVARAAPLVIPPDYSLAPPQPGAATTGSAATAQAQALDALFGGAAPRSSGERATLDAAGSDNADPGIRSAAGDPQTNVVDKGSTTRDIVAAPEGDGQNARAAAR